MKVFRVDEMTWVASETEEQAVKYAEQEIGIDLEDFEIEECDVNKPNAMWWTINDFPKGSTIKEYDEGSEEIYEGIVYGYWEGQPAKMISYTEAHELHNEKLPYIIAVCI